MVKLRYQSRTNFKSVILCVVNFKIFQHRHIDRYIDNLINWEWAVKQIKCHIENPYSRNGQLAFEGTKSIVHTTKVILEDLFIN